MRPLRYRPTPVLCPHNSRASMPILTSGGSSLGSACDGSLVSSDHCARGLIPAEPARPFESSCRCRRCGSGIVKEPLDGISEPIGILRIDERSSFAKDFRQRTAIRRHNRHAHGHRFEDWETESLFKRRLNEHRRTLVQLTALERIDVADVLNSAGERRPADPFEPRARLLRRLSSQYKTWETLTSGRQPFVGVQQNTDVLSRLQRPEKQYVPAVGGW